MSEALWASLREYVGALRRDAKELRDEREPDYAATLEEIADEIEKRLDGNGVPRMHVAKPGEVIVFTLSDSVSEAERDGAADFLEREYGPRQIRTVVVAGDVTVGSFDVKRLRDLADRFCEGGGPDNKNDIVSTREECGIELHHTLNDLGFRPRYLP